MYLQKNVTNQTVHVGPLYSMLTAGLVNTALVASDLLVSKDGVDFVTATGTLTQNPASSGIYRYTFTQSETNAGRVTLLAKVDDYTPQMLQFITLKGDPTDFLAAMAAAVLSFASADVEDTAAARTLAGMIAGSPAGKWDIVDGVFTAYKDNDDEYYNRDLGTSSDVDPVVSVTP